ncbi:hypothetical protein PAXINDRAFT_157987 [Paxillus involutus ATCC 200175]|uniref:Uncharacterized protein n=1 Tax=Paxillus involutus ATCC 200175 TaxID=664439 RepID=A0A0C9T0C7_PAXIN|nr:hypothetical protein PAXINDRAFT_157987 [Paxillus involutus ATCC 200175]
MSVLPPTSSRSTTVTVAISDITPRQGGETNEMSRHLTGIAEKQELKKKRSRAASEADAGLEGASPAKFLCCDQSKEAGMQADHDVIVRISLKKVLHELVQELKDIKAQIGKLLANTPAQLDALGSAPDGCRICCPRLRHWQRLGFPDPTEHSQLPHWNQWGDLDDKGCKDDEEPPQDSRPSPGRLY